MTRQERWRATPKTLFRVATAENRDVHLAVLSLFADRDLTDPALTLEDIPTVLPREAPDLRADEAMMLRSLDQVVQWAPLDESRRGSTSRW